MLEKEIKPISTIKDQVYNIIRSGILDGTFQQGEWLQEQDLAKRFSVSRSPIRESLKQLVGDGLLVNIPNKGVFVKKLADHDVEEIYEIRIMFEQFAIYKTKNNLTRENKDLLLGIKRNLNTSYKKGNLKSYTIYDNELHKTIIALSGNSVLADIENKIFGLLYPFRHLSLLNAQRYEESIIEHTEIIDSIICGNVDEAWRIDLQHLTKAKQSALKYIKDNY